MTIEQPGTRGPGHIVGAENYEHYRTEHQLADFTRTRLGQGIQPGELAPDFELPSASGEQVRLSAFRGRPVLLHFGSLT